MRSTVVKKLRWRQCAAIPRVHETFNLVLVAFSPEARGREIRVGSTISPMPCALIADLLKLQVH